MKAFLLAVCNVVGTVILGIFKMAVYRDEPEKKHVQDLLRDDGTAGDTDDQRRLDELFGPDNRTKN